MTRDSRFDILFEPVKIGPVTAPNRFYQVPHCTGMGYQLPQTLATMRGIKAAGGWGVVNTEYCSIHPSSDDVPHPFASLWDEGDVRNMAAMADMSKLALPHYLVFLKIQPIVIELLLLLSQEINLNLEQ